MNRETMRAHIVLNKLPMIISPEKSYTLKDVESFRRQGKIPGGDCCKLNVGSSPGEQSRESRKSTPSSAEICAKRVLKRAKKSNRQIQLGTFLSPGDQEDFKDDTTKRRRGRPKKLQTKASKLRQRKNTEEKKENGQLDASRVLNEISLTCPTCGAKFESAKDKQTHVVTCLKDNFSVQFGKIKGLPAAKTNFGKGRGFPTDEQKQQESDEEFARRILEEEKLQQEIQEKQDAELARLLQEVSSGSGPSADRKSQDAGSPQECVKRGPGRPRKTPEKDKGVSVRDGKVTKRCGGPSKTPLKDRRVSTDDEKAAEKYVCQFCQKDLSYMTTDRKAQHMNRCLDMINPSIDLVKITSGSSPRETQNASDRQITQAVPTLTSSSSPKPATSADGKPQHVNKCMNVGVGSTEETTNCEQEIAATSHPTTKDEQQIAATSHPKNTKDETTSQTLPSTSAEHITCQFCNRDLTHMIMERRELHVNRCIDLNLAGGASVITAVCSDVTELPAPDTSTAITATTIDQSAVFCPVCKRNIKLLKIPQIHIKKCALKNKVSTIELMKMMKEQKAAMPEIVTAHPGTADVKAAIQPQQPEQKPKKARKLKPPGSLHAEQMALAKAMSLSVKDQEEEHVTRPKRGRRGAKNRGQAVPILLQKSQEEVQTSLAARLSDIVSESAFETHNVSSTPPMKVSNLKRKSRGQKNTGQLWSLTGKNDPIRSKHEEFYVQDLQPVISLPRLDPAKFKTPVKDVVDDFSTQALGKTCQILADLADENTSSISPSQSKASDTSIQQTKATSTSQSHHQQELVRDLSNMINNSKYSDVIIHVSEDQIIHGHSFMLGSRCPHLAKMIDEIRGQTKKQKIDLQWGDIPLDVAMCVLKFLYSAEIDVPEACLQPVMQLAERFEIQALQARCSEMLDAQGTMGGWDHAEEKDKSTEDKEFVEKDVDELLNSLWGDENSSREGSRNGTSSSEKDDEKFEKELDTVYEYMSTQRIVSRKSNGKATAKSQKVRGRRRKSPRSKGPRSKNGEVGSTQDEKKSRSRESLKGSGTESSTDVCSSPEVQKEEKSLKKNGQTGTRREDSSDERRTGSPSSVAPVSEHSSAAVSDPESDSGSKAKPDQPILFETPVSRNQVSLKKSSSSVTPDLFGGDESSEVGSVMRDNSEIRGNTLTVTAITPDVCADGAPALKKRRCDDMSAEVVFNMPDSVQELPHKISMHQRREISPPGKPVWPSEDDGSSPAKGEEDPATCFPSSPEDVEMEDLENNNGNGNEAAGDAEQDAEPETEQTEVKGDGEQIIISSDSEEDKTQSKETFEPDSPIFGDTLTSRAIHHTSAELHSPYSRSTDRSPSPSPSPKFGASQPVSSTARSGLGGPVIVLEDCILGNAPMEKEASSGDEKESSDELKGGENEDVADDGVQKTTEGETAVLDMTNQSDAVMPDDSLTDFMDDGGYNMDMFVVQDVSLRNEVLLDHVPDAEALEVKQNENIVVLESDSEVLEDKQNEGAPMIHESDSENTVEEEKDVACAEADIDSEVRIDNSTSSEGNEVTQGHYTEEDNFIQGHDSCEDKEVTQGHNSSLFALDLDSSLIMWTGNPVLDEMQNDSLSTSEIQLGMAEMTTPKTTTASTSNSSATPIAAQGILDSPITPMPDYQDMTTPALKGELNKFGVRPVPRKKAVTLLKNIYGYTHQDKLDKLKSKTSSGDTATRGDVETFEDPSEDAPSQQIITEDSEVSTDRNTSENSDSEAEDFGESILHGGADDEVLTASQQTSDEDKELQIKNFMKRNEKWHHRILQYEPFDLSELTFELKEAGISCSQAKLMNILDEQCITFRIQQGNKGRHKKARKKKVKNVEDEI
ncbi:structure-specific endonuclease subunit SLX4-like [Ptychodera flava]|uniref:structure-specific endonuclease subunit SLX4-like n=1 Tax=Ptychodera flava TaxID=63121 RepID=UPI003969F186